MFTIANPIRKMSSRKLMDISRKFQNKRSGEKSNHIYETYKNMVMSYGRHIYVKAYDMAKSTMCAYLHSDNGLPHYNCVLKCCSQFPSINIPY